MAINTRWDDVNKTRVLVEFETSWTWDQLENAIEQIDIFLSQTQHTVDIIIDLEGSEIPRDYLTIAQKLFTNPDMGMRPNEGNRVVVGASNWMKTAYTTIQKTFSKQLEGRHILFANDLSHARGMLHSMRLS